MPRPSDPLARARLLAAARRVFVEKGLDRAKVEDITQAASLSKGAFYLHFESKEQAFTEILSEALQELAGIFTEGHKGHRQLYEQGLEHMLSEMLERDIGIFEVVWKHRAIMGLLMGGGGSADYQHLTETFVQSIEKQVEELFVFGIEHGYYRPDLDPATAAVFCAGGYDRIARQMLREKKKPDFRSLVKRCHLYVIHAFGTSELIDIAERLHGEESGPMATAVHEPRSAKASRLA